MPVARVQRRSRLPSRVMHACGMRPSPTVATAKTGLGRSPQGTKTRSGSGDRFAFEGFFPKISEQSEEIFCFRAGERAFAFPLRGEGKQIPCGNLLDEVECLIHSTSSAASAKISEQSEEIFWTGFPSRGSLT